METNGAMARVQRQREAIDALIRLLRQHHRIVEKRMEGLGVHHSQHRTLMRLSRMGAGVSQKEIARAMDVSPACVARTIKALSAAGLIEKADGTDGRCNEISLLPRGEALVNDSLALFRQIDDEMFQSVSDAEIEALQRILGRIRDNLAMMEQPAQADCPGDERPRDAERSL